MSGKHLTRRQRRAGVAEGTTSSVENTPMVKPDYESKPTTKTLLDIADERREDLFKQVDERTNQNARQSDEGAEPEPIGDEAVLEAITYGFTLSVVHFTFDILAQHQYGQEIDWKPTAEKLKFIFPMLLLMVYLMHARPLVSYPLVRQLIFLLGAIGSGCYGLWIGNMEQYLAVQKKFPSVAVICLWTVLEMRLPFITAFLAAVACFAWWHNFSPY